MAEGSAWRKKGRFAVAYVSGAIGVVATLKSFAETSTGMTFEANRFPFYLGAAAVTVYMSIGVGIMVAGGVAAASSALGIDEDKSTNAVLAVAAVVALLMLTTLVQAGVIFDYDGTDAFGRTAIAVLGILVVGGGLWYAFKRTGEE